MPQPYFEMEELWSVTPWVNRLYFKSSRNSSYLGLRLVKARHKNLFPLLSGVKPHPMVGSGRYAEPITVKWQLSSPQSMLQIRAIWDSKGSANGLVEGRPNQSPLHCIYICSGRFICNAKWMLCYGELYKKKFPIYFCSSLYRAFYVSKGIVETVYQFL